MSEKFLHRGDAPFGDEVWERIDGAVVGAAKGQLTARRLLHIEGPYGLGFKAIPGPDAPVGGAADVEVIASAVVPAALIRKTFALPARDIAAYEQNGVPLDLGPAAAAAVACAKQEDEVIFNGSKKLGTEGLLTARGTASVKLKSWSEPGVAADDLIGAVTKLDAAGFHGPYALALAPERYNLLFRRYQQGNATEIEHLRQLITEGIAKAPAIDDGGVLLAAGRQYATIALGQDLAAGFIGPAGADYEFSVSESVLLRLVVPGAVCVLKKA